MRYRNLLAALLAMAPCAVAQDALPSAKEVMAKYVQVTGGKDAYAKVKSYIVRGKMQVPNAPAGQNTGDIIIKGLMKPRRQFQSVRMGNRRIERFCSDKTAWEIASGKTRQLKKVELAQAMRDASFVFELTPEKLFKSMKVEGKQKIGDEECYKLVVTPKAGKPETLYYGVESGLKAVSYTHLTLPTKA